MRSLEPEIGLMLHNNAISKQRFNAISKATPERVIFYYAEIIYVLLFILTTNIETLKLTRSMIGDVSIILCIICSLAGKWWS